MHRGNMFCDLRVRAHIPARDRDTSKDIAALLSSAVTFPVTYWMKFLNIQDEFEVGDARNEAITERWLRKSAPLGSLPSCLWTETFQLKTLAQVMASDDGDG